MTAEQLKQESMKVVNWMLGHRFEFDTQKEYVVIYTPYKNISKESIPFFLVKTREGYLISDEVDTFTELGVTGYDIFQDKETTTYFQELLKKYGVTFHEEELFIEFQEITELPKAIEQLHQCIEQIYSLYRLHIYKMKYEQT